MSRLRLSPAEALTLAALTVWGFAPLVLMARHAGATGDVLVAADGAFAADQLQYLSWIREAGDGVLAGNSFDLAPQNDVFLHPMFLISGLLWKLGLGLQAAYLVWKPVAIVVLFAGFALFVRRTVEGGRAQAAGLALALFYIPATAKFLEKLGVGSERARGELAGLLGEAFAAGSLWGYLPTAISVGAMALYLVAAERARAADGRVRTRALAAATLAGAVAAWLHPWQGEILVLMTLGLLVWERFRRPVLPLLVPLAGALLPLLYYFALSRLDDAWEVAQRQQELPHAPAWVVVTVILPLLPFAIAGVPRRPRGVLERSLLLWPPAALAAYVALSPSVPGHTLEGISLPLAVMAVRGWRALRLPAAAGAVAIAVLAIPGAYLAADTLRDAVDSRTQPHYLSSHEADAMEQLRRDPRPGGVIASPELATAVPVHSGRQVWTGHPSWTPDFTQRVRTLRELFGGTLRGVHAEQALLRSGARFVLAGCEYRSHDLRTTAPSVVAGARRYGCVTLYELREPVA